MNNVNFDKTALFNIGYGLYIVTVKDGDKYNGLIVNTVAQVSESPCRIAVSVSKSNYSHSLIKDNGYLNVCPITTDTDFSVFKRFGFQSGVNTDKFEGLAPEFSKNGLPYLPEYANAFISLRVESYTDLGSHGLFICSVEEAENLSRKETMTYGYYHKSVKPKPQQKKKGFECTICGYVHEGENLPDDFICPICKHGADVFVEIGDTAKEEKKPRTPKRTGFECTICGYVHESDSLPEDFKCPICGYGAENFKPLT